MIFGSYIDGACSVTQRKGNCHRYDVFKLSRNMTVTHDYGTE